MIRFMTALLLLAQFPTNIPSVFKKPDRFPTIQLVANVVSYDSFVTLQISAADVVVKSNEGRYFRLVYNFYHFGFDQPSSTPNQMMPREMVRDGSILWKFQIHLPRNGVERVPCTPRPKGPLRTPWGEWASPAPYTIVPGHDVDEPIADAVLPCLVIESWTNLKTGASGPERLPPNSK